MRREGIYTYPEGTLPYQQNMLIALCDITSQKIRTTWQLTP